MSKGKVCVIKVRSDSDPARVGTSIIYELRKKGSVELIGMGSAIEVTVKAIANAYRFKEPNEAIYSEPVLLKDDNEGRTMLKYIVSMEKESEQVMHVVEKYDIEDISLSGKNIIDVINKYRESSKCFVGALPIVANGNTSYVHLIFEK